MPKNNETNVDFSLYFNLPNPGLRSYFDNVRKGQPDEYRTTFARGSSVQEVLNEWKPLLSQISDKWPSLMDFENDLAEKVGPLSIMLPLAERMKDIDSYYDLVLLRSEPIMPRAIKAVCAEWRRASGLRMKSQSHTVEKMKLSTNSGAPYFTKRRNVVDKTVPCDCLYGIPWAIPKGDIMTLLGKQDDEWLATAVLGWRGQEGGIDASDVKQRVVWMFPLGVNICELQVYQPLIEAAQRFELVPAWVGLDSVDRRVTRLFDTKGPEDDIICTDFSKFDQHFNKNLQDAALEILQNVFTSDKFIHDWSKHVFPIKYAIPLAYDYGKVRKGLHGMASGSGGTNADETLVHRALQFEAAIKAKQLLNPNSQCLGDDGILSYPGVNVEDVMRSYTSHGLEMNAEKQYVSKHDCVYLRRWHHQNYRVDGVCVGVYSTCRALGRLCEQERYYDPEMWGPKMVALRQLSIIENVKYHPLRDQFAEFCMKRDKYRLGIDIPGFLDNIAKVSSEAIEVMPDFMGYAQSLGKGDPTKGIENWWIVNYLKSK